MIRFETSPAEYRHWSLEIDGGIARLNLDVREDEPLVAQYRLKLNSYDLGVDIELADAVERLRFEHPEVKSVVLSSAKPDVFCAGANIFMLGKSSHAFKVNFCKFTNETRLAMEDASRFSGQRYLAGCNGTTAGGGYELALACDEIVLVDDGKSAVSLPEIPLLGVLPGTGGLTRLVDKRRVRRDHADVFCTLAEGIKGRRALDWRLVDALAPRSRFDEFVRQRAASFPDRAFPQAPGSVALDKLRLDASDNGLRGRYMELAIDRTLRTATLTVSGPDRAPQSASEIHSAGADFWALRLFREIDRALLHLRFDEPEIGVLLLKSRGDIETVRSVDRALAENSGDWLVNEILLLIKRTLKRLDLTARTIIALIEPESCFAGSLFELALAADRSYMLDDATQAVRIALTPLNRGVFPMGNGLSRLHSRFYGDVQRVGELLCLTESLSAREAEKAGLVTFAIDDIDYEDDVRVAIEERASLSPDALTGMEANLRFVGPETIETKIFGRLSAWQNWMFSRPNAVGERGALTLYGKPDRPAFDWKRT
jgi:benzoyl-CoA-dihydrodiol lyase